MENKVDREIESYLDKSETFLISCIDNIRVLHKIRYEFNIEEIKSMYCNDKMIFTRVEHDGRNKLVEDNINNQSKIVNTISLYYDKSDNIKSDIRASIISLRENIINLHKENHVLLYDDMEKKKMYSFRNNDIDISIDSIDRNLILSYKNVEKYLSNKMKIIDIMIKAQLHEMTYIKKKIEESILKIHDNCKKKYNDYEGAKKKMNIKSEDIPVDNDKIDKYLHKFNKIYNDYFDDFLIRIRDMLIRININIKSTLFYSKVKNIFIENKYDEKKINQVANALELYIGKTMELLSYNKSDESVVELFKSNNKSPTVLFARKIWSLADNIICKISDEFIMIKNEWENTKSGNMLKINMLKKSLIGGIKKNIESSRSILEDTIKSITNDTNNVINESSRNLKLLEHDFEQNKNIAIDFLYAYKQKLELLLPKYIKGDKRYIKIKKHVDFINNYNTLIKNYSATTINIGNMYKILKNYEVVKKMHSLLKY